MGKNALFSQSKTREVKMSYPVGQINCKLDSKGRLMMPSEFKEQLGIQANDGFVMRLGAGKFNKCLELYTRNDWDGLQDKLHSSLNPFNPIHQAVMRKFNDGTRVAKLDANGRLQIPKELIEDAHLVKDIVLTSVTTKMEIWDKALYKEELDGIDDELYLQILTDIK